MLKLLKCLASETADRALFESFRNAAIFEFLEDLGRELPF